MAELFQGANFDRKVRTRVDGLVNWFWPYQAPERETPGAAFSLRWTGWLQAPKPGRYTLTVIADDGVKLWLDGTLRIDEWHGAACATYRVGVDLTDQPHPLRIDYYDMGYLGALVLSWEQEGGFGEQVVPAAALSHSPATAEEAGLQPGDQTPVMPAPHTVIQRSRANAAYQKKEYAAAIAHNEEAARIEPTNVQTRNELAWWLATCPAPAVRNGPRAVEHARRACELTDWKDAGLLDTLAAAHAEAGQFAEAVTWQTKAIALAPPPFQAEFRSRLELYRAGKSYSTGAAPPPPAPRPVPVTKTPPPPAPVPPPPPPPRVKSRQTALAGGGGGNPFQDQPTQPALLIGFRVSVGQFGPQAIIKSLQPLYRTPDGKTILGEVHGAPAGPTRDVVCEAGHAVSGLLVWSGDRVKGVKLLVRRVEGKGLAAGPSRAGESAGGIAGTRPTVLGNDGKAIIGIRGRSGTDLDAIGLLQPAE